MLFFKHLDEQGWCIQSFDGVLCWESAPPDTIKHMPCPNYIQGSNPENFAERHCLRNGSWAFNHRTGQHETNYSLCGFTAMPVSRN
ncbi:secretin receptor-like isoform X4 [Dinothrombium tinctorium]|uniref:Secretin receptor-like isoform X4 n=1 Tax=Dinothrombium tinctorium TaxID=1965070 RepID=A0A443QXI2_9ACAR|nr:secretin receptor-like isoform X4 [Dinothrombium tinctorium]